MIKRNQIYLIWMAT